MMLAALGAADSDVRPAGQRLAVTAVVGLFAPLFWPGCAATRRRTALRVVGWSVATAGLAALILQLLGDRMQPLLSASSCTMLLLIALVTHTVVAGLEGRLLAASAEPRMARETAGRSAAVALAFVGALPLWLGPAAELLSVRFAGVIEVVIGISPLTHLAVASGNDLLRNQWFYQHANLANLQFSYPGLARLVLAYGALVLMLPLVAQALRRQRGVRAGAT